MNKTSKFIVFYTSLFVLEVLISYFILLVDHKFDSYYFKIIFDGVVLWNFWRLLFYSLPLFLILFVLFNYTGYMKIGYKPLLFSVINLTIYVSLSYLSEFLWKNTPLPVEGIMFKITCLAIFLSPIILGYIPYFRRLIDNI